MRQKRIFLRRSRGGEILRYISKKSRLLIVRRPTVSILAPVFSDARFFSYRLRRQSVNGSQTGQRAVGENLYLIPKIGDHLPRIWGGILTDVPGRPR